VIRSEMRSTARPKSSPTVGGRTMSRSPASMNIRTSNLASRPPWNVFNRNQPNRDDSPSTSRHQIQRSVVSPNASQRTRSPVLQRSTPGQLHYPPVEWSAGTHQRQQQQQQYTQLQPHRPIIASTIEPLNAMGDAGEQLELFGKLQQVVVQLTHSAADEKAKQTRLQQRLESYEMLVKDQDRMICELRAMNARLQKERDALSSFRQPSAHHHDAFVDELHHDPAAAVTPLRGRQAAGTRGSPAAGVTLQHDESLAAGAAAVTPKTKTFVQSLVDQLKEEKRLRYQVEEQSSRMMGEQQLTIHRLEERLHRNGGSSPAGGRSPRASVGATRSSTMVGVMQSPEGDEHDPSRSMMAPTTDRFRSMANPSPSDDGPSVRITPAGDQPQSIRSGSSSTDVAASSLSMENASLLLQQIKLRHGL
jgi:hypothetical protein